MQKNINFQNISNHYSKMTEGDKSCVVTMLQNTGAQQVTSLGSHHDKFYEELSKSGWTVSVELSAYLKKSSVRSWQVTEAGTSSMPSLLLALTTTSARNEFQTNRHKEIAKFCIKLFAFYFLCQLCLFLIGVMIGKMELNGSILNEYLPVAGLLISVLTSLYFASRTWSRKKHGEERVTNIAYCEFLELEVQLISILSVVVILILHLFIELTAMQIGWQNEGKSFTKLFIQTIVLCGAVWWLSKTFLPIFLRDQHTKQFKTSK